MIALRGSSHGGELGLLPGGVEAGDLAALLPQFQIIAMMLRSYVLGFIIIRGVKIFGSHDRTRE